MHNLDFMLYILNRRIRPQEILLKKFNIIETFLKSNFVITGGIEKGLTNRFEDYVKKGPY